jgi:hypothetical protein
MRWGVILGFVVLAGCSEPVARAGASVPGLAEYNQIQEGMNYGQVAHHLNAEGELASSSTADGHELKTYDFQGDGGRITVWFVDGVLTMKSQRGLK